MLKYNDYLAKLCILLLLMFVSSSSFSNELPKLSLQLHSIKNDISDNFKETLKKVAAMGFSGVEFAGKYGPYKNDPVGLKNYLDSLGLEVSGAHTPLSQLQGTNGSKNLAFFQQLGVTLLIIPHDARIDNPDKIDELISELKVTSERANIMGMKLGYHNHAKEFKAFKNETFWDYLAQNTPQEFFLQLDVGWANFAKVDPIEFVKRYPNRTLSSHFKIRTYQGKPGSVSKESQVILGQDSYDWQGLYEVLAQYGGTQWVVIEQEEYPEGSSALESIKSSIDGLLLKVPKLKKFSEIEQTTVLSSPNILFIYTDDQAPWGIGRSGNTQAITPNLDKLASEGMYLPNSYTTTPVCSPSRAGLLTSKYGFELGINDWINDNPKAKTLSGHEFDLGLESVYETWPKILQKSGYYTGLIGKWHLGKQERFHPTQHGYNEFTGFKEGGTSPVNPNLEVAFTQKKHEGLTVDVLTNYTIDFLNKHKDKKFALSLHLRAPHYRFLPVAPEDAEPFVDMEIVLPNPNYPGLNTKRAKQLMREYLSSIKSIDRNIGKIMLELELLKIEDNTLVVFTSDHGYNMGHNGIWHKGNGFWLLKNNPEGSDNIPKGQRPNMYDNSIKVPSIVRWPNVIKPDSVNKSSMSNLDWFPTLVSIGNGKISQNNIIRGQDFTPAFLNEKLLISTDYYATYSTLHQSITHMRMYSDGKYKLIRDFINNNDEFYHLSADPGETTNLLLKGMSEKQKNMFAKFNQIILDKMSKTDDPILSTIKIH